MSGRDTMHAELRQLADLRLISSDVERELHELKQEQNQLDEHLAAARRQLSETPKRRFWRGFATGVVVVGAVWGATVSVAHFTLGN